MTDQLDTAAIREQMDALDESISYEVGRSYTITAVCTGRETYRLMSISESDK